MTFHHLTGAYALDALDHDELVAFEEHLAGCEECRAEVASFGPAAAMLSAGLSTPPPAALRAQVLSSITRVRPLPPVAAPTPLARRRWPVLAAAAAVVAVIGGGIVWQQTRDDSRDNARDREQVQVLTAEERILQAPDAARERLTFPGGAAATLVRSASQHRALLITEAMPPAPDGSVYQVWFDVPGEGMVAAAVMPPKPDQTVLLSGDAALATAAGITVEPTGGSVTPTSETIALFDFDNLTPVGGTDAT